MGEINPSSFDLIVQRLAPLPFFALKFPGVRDFTICLHEQSDERLARFWHVIEPFQNAPAPQTLITHFCKERIERVSSTTRAAKKTITPPLRCHTDQTDG